MAIRRVTTDVASTGVLQPGNGGMPSRDRKLTQAAPGLRGKPQVAQFGAPRVRKKTLVDIELDADSDLEDFENNNQMMKIKGAVEEEEEESGDEADSEIRREASQLDKKPGSLQSDCELERKGLDDDDGKPAMNQVDSLQGDSVIMKVMPAGGDTVSID